MKRRRLDSVPAGGASLATPGLSAAGADET
jgi:hypothetical protein